MDAGPIALVVVLAILGFWVVGAYNRLVRLRNVAAKAYAACDAVLVERIAETDRLCDALVRAGGEPREFIALARAAARQAAQACDAARARPLLRRTMMKVAMAVSVLDGALHALQRTAPRPAGATGDGVPAADTGTPAAGASAAAVAGSTPTGQGVEGDPAELPAAATAGSVPPTDAPDAAAAAGPADPTGRAAPSPETPENTARAEDPPGPAPIDSPAPSAPAAPAGAPDLAQAGRSLQALASLAPRWELAQANYDAAVAVYNEAAHQFPTRIVAVLFSLRPAQNLAPLWPDTLGASLAPPG